MTQSELVGILQRSALPFPANYLGRKTVSFKWQKCLLTRFVSSSPCIIYHSTSFSLSQRQPRRNRHQGRQSEDKGAQSLIRVYHPCHCCPPGKTLVNGYEDGVCNDPEQRNYWSPQWLQVVETCSRFLNRDFKCACTTSLSCVQMEHPWTLWNEMEELWRNNNRGRTQGFLRWKRG